ncbi:MAG: hypothetical protein OEY28_06105 [Nitrospira sp.]|nr:hypothetical protein [Nitrospira sp.]
MMSAGDLPLAVGEELDSAIADLSTFTAEDRLQIILGVIAPDYYQHCRPGGCSGPGHDQDKATPLLTIDMDLPNPTPVFRYPHHLLRPGTIDALNILNLAESMGVLPAAGGLIDQTAQFIPALAALRYAIASSRKTPTEGNS